MHFVNLCRFRLSLLWNKQFKKILLFSNFREFDDGKTTRTLQIGDAERIKYKAKVAYDVTIYTGDVAQAGTG